MGFLEELPGRARAVSGHVVLVEGDDPRIVEAAGALCKEQIARITILCPGVKLGAELQRLRSQGVTVTDPASDPRRQRLFDLLHSRFEL
jgi:phosphotransacetylase